MPWQKKIQWNFPDIFGEDKFVVLFGGLHIEMEVLKCLGDLLDSSGWTNALIQAGVVTSGRADAVLKASHVTRARRAHQISASALYILLQRAYSKNETEISFEDWIANHVETSPTFQYWCLILELEFMMLVFVRAIREAKFQLYVEVLQRLVIWMFALDKPNYSRWLSVHIQDMMDLQKVHPSLYQSFLEGHFVYHKSKKMFSAIARDQCHEQNNALVKGDGGAIGLTENPQALARWMLSGPEVAMVVQDFEDVAKLGIRQETFIHHEQTNSVQDAFIENVRKLVTVYEEMGNPFLEESEDLLTLDSQEIADEATVHTVREIEKIGRKQYEEFVTKRLIEKSQSIHEPIKSNKLSLFRSPPVRERSRSQLTVQSLKNDRELFSRLFISCQTRGGDLLNFFEHENQQAPPSLSDFGKQRIADKSNLLPALEGLIPVDEEREMHTQVAVIEGSVMVHMLMPIGCKTFDDYAEQKVMPYALKILQDVTRVDIIFDVYQTHSLKSVTRERRGKGRPRRVTGGGDLPGNWQNFLRNDTNKTELFGFLVSKLKHADIPTGKQLLLTLDDKVISIPEMDVSPLSPCSHEEADTRVFLHVSHSVQVGFTKVTIHTNDTDVVVLAICWSQEINGLEEIWLMFGTGKSKRTIPCHLIGSSLGKIKSRALLFFHSFTGCDTVSSFFNHPKPSAWATWTSFPEVTPTFYELSSAPDDISEEQLHLLERFVILMYDKTSNEESVNICRKDLFTRKSRQIENIPPTRNALLQHSKRAALQAGHIWFQSVIRMPELPDPAHWGWMRLDENSPWKPFWTDLPEASKACRELIKCQCKTSCRRGSRCSCAKANLKCTSLCFCSGECTRD